jgi:hypothetical protein
VVVVAVEGGELAVWYNCDGKEVKFKRQSDVVVKSSQVGLRSGCAKAESQRPPGQFFDCNCGSVPVPVLEPSLPSLPQTWRFVGIVEATKTFLCLLFATAAMTLPLGLYEA